tara:strand:- start:102 stop:644 length:543 start_codon:yes stop_codon:yes gene_type:complete
MNEQMRKLREEIEQTLNDEKESLEAYDPRIHQDVLLEALEYVLKQIDTRHRNNAEWFDNGPVVSKEANGRLYEVWANGLFSITSPEGDRFKGSNSATNWLVEHGVSNDADLEEVMDDESDWDLDASRWFDLIVFDIEMKDGIRHARELYCGEPTFHYDEDDFNAWIDEAIAQDLKDGEEE